MTQHIWPGPRALGFPPACPGVDPTSGLRQLDTDYVDIFHLHGLGPARYDEAMADIVPALLREKAKGKFRHLAVSETGPRDPEHTMLARAVEEPCWEVFMLGFSMMHQNA